MELTAHTRQWDQAEGLRRLMATRFIRTIAIASDGKDAPEIATRLAYALAGSGKQVLVTREERTLAWADGHPGFRLERACPSRDLASPPSPGERIEAAVHLLQMACPRRESQSLVQQPGALAPLLHQLEGVNVALVTLDGQQVEEMVRVASLVQNVIVVMQPSVEGIKEAYRCIKILSMLKAKQQFRILVNAVENEWEAQVQYKHFAWVATRYLQVSMEFMGWLPPCSVNLSRPASVYERLVEQVDQWRYPSGEAMQLEVFLYALFGSEVQQGNRMEA